MAEKRTSRIHRLSVGPIYLVLICCLIVLILIVNGYFEINRTRNSLRGILENQGVALLRGLEREIQNAVSVIEVMEGVPGGHLLNITSSTNFFALEDAIVDHLLEIATAVDHNEATRTLSPSELKSLAEKEGLRGIDIVGDPSPSRLSEKGLSTYLPLLEGTRDMVIIPFKKFAPDEEDLFSVAIRRTQGEGIVAVSIDSSQMKNLRRRFAIQNILETMGFGGGIQYLSIFDRSLSPVAQTKREEIGKILDTPFLKSVQAGSQPQSRFRPVSHEQEVFEIAKMLHLEGEPYGVIQVGLSTWQTQKILSLSTRNIILSVTVLLGLGITGVILIYVNQNRHFQKLKEMEERTQAAERLLSIGKLGAGVAHEIRNPLNAVGMAIQRLHREFLPQEEEKAKEFGQFMRVIREEIKRLNRIVDQFVHFSKPDKLTLAPASLADVVGNISLLFAEEVKARSIVMQNQVNRKLPHLIMDKGTITQALINIVTNSLHAMEGGGALTIKAKLDRRDWVRIVVSDTGKGIAEKEIEKVFDYSYTTRDKGLGLGLPIAHKIIEEHGGRITIESQVGEGTTVSILLPVGGPR